MLSTELISSAKLIASSIPGTELIISEINVLVASSI